MNVSLLNRYSIQARKFSNHSGIFQNTKVEIQLNDNKGTITTSGINEENLISVVVHFRTFYMKTSELNFPAIVGEILNEQKLSEYHVLAKDFLSAWNRLLDPNRLNTGGISLTVNRSVIRAKNNFDIWVNEAYLHPEQYKPGSKKGLDNIKSHPIIESLSKLNMVDILQKLIALIIGFNVQIVEKITLENT